MTTLTVAENGTVLTFTYNDFVKYHGFKSPCGLSQSFKVLELALPLLGDGEPIERRELKISTAFTGPGARDGFEMIARAVSGDRYVVNPELGGEQVTESPSGKYYFRLEYRNKVVEVKLKPEHIRADYIQLSRTPDRSESDQSRLQDLKQELADRILPLTSEQLYEINVQTS
ncbi:hypothetical protein ACTOV4_21695 [Brucella sp. C7-11G]